MAKPQLLKGYEFAMTGAASYSKNNIINIDNSNIYSHYYLGRKIVEFGGKLSNNGSSYYGYEYNNTKISSTTDVVISFNIEKITEKQLLAIEKYKCTVISIEQFKYIIENKINISKIQKSSIGKIEINGDNLQKLLDKQMEEEKRKKETLKLKKFLVMCGILIDEKDISKSKYVSKKMDTHIEDLFNGKEEIIPGGYRIKLNG